MSETALSPGPRRAPQSFRLVWEDEADASSGLISWMPLLAPALLGREAGEGVAFQGGEADEVGTEP